MTKLNEYMPKIILFFILTLSVYIYTYSIKFIPLDGDELFTLNIVNMNSIFDVIKIGNINDTHPPLYHILLFIFVQFAGVSETSVRLLSSIFGTLSILSIYILAKKMFSEKEGLISASVMLFIWSLIIVNQYARGYALLLFLSILTMIFLYDITDRLGQNKNIKKSLIFYVISTTLCIYTHYFGLLLIFIEFLFLFFIRFKYIKQILPVYFFIFLLYLPWIPFIHTRYIHTVYPDFIQWVRWNVFGGYENIFLLPLLCTYPFIFIIYKKISNGHSMSEFVNIYKSEIMLIVLAAVPFIFVWISDKFLFKCYNHRYIIFSIAPYYILAARGIVLIFRKFILITTATLLLLTGMSFHVIISHIQHLTGNYSDQPINALMDVKKKYGKYPDSFLLLEKANYFDYHLNNYCKEIPNSKIKIIDYTEKNSKIKIMNFITQQKPKYVWLIDSLKKEHFLILNNTHNRIYSNSYKGWDVYLFEKKQIKV
ncbi:MAG: glycosyltransferase family 39 protein [Endomicrobiaceae bacterium]|nr:glycosyltransferase family 39 protein [Endomicrobiaceae bacterium]